MWRLTWAFKQLCGRKSRAALAEALAAPGRYKRAILAKFVPGLYRAPMLFQLKAGGVFRVREFMTLYIFHEIFVDKCYDLPFEVPGEPVIIDIGANTGLFALRAKQLWPAARLFCYEPFPPNYEELRFTLESSRLPATQSFREGVGGQSRTAALHVHPRNIGGHSILDSSASGTQVTINLVDLRTVLDRTPGGTCDLMKLDCEGAEQEIIRSIDGDLATRICRIIYENTPGGDAQGLKDHLVSLGYKITTFRGLVVASRAG